MTAKPFTSASNLPDAFAKLPVRATAASLRWQHLKSICRKSRRKQFPSLQRPSPSPETCCRCAETALMYCGTWFSGRHDLSLKVGLHDRRGLFQPKQVYETSMSPHIHSLSSSHPAADQTRTHVTGQKVVSPGLDTCSHIQELTCSRNKHRCSTSE